jgi:hypothetical protein
LEHRQRHRECKVYRHTDLAAGALQHRRALAFSKTACWPVRQRQRSGKGGACGTLHGLVAFNAATIGAFGPTSVLGSYWDIESTRRSTDAPAGGAPEDGFVADSMGLTTQQFKAGLPDGFDPAVWGIDPDVNDGYPHLLR